MAFLISIFKQSNLNHNKRESSLAKFKTKEALIMTKDPITIKNRVKNKVKHHLSTTIAVVNLSYLVYYILLFKNKLLQELWPTTLLWTITLIVILSLNIILHRVILKALAQENYSKMFLLSKGFFSMVVCISTFGIVGCMQTFRNVHEHTNAVAALFIFLAINLVFCVFIAIQRVYIEKCISDLQREDSNNKEL